MEKEPQAKIVHDPRVIWNTRDVVESLGGAAVQSKTGHAFVKRSMREAKMTDKDIELKIFEQKKRLFTSNFKSYSRDRRNQIFSNKTNPPPVGQYHPKKEMVQRKGRSSHFDPHHVTAVEASN